MGMMITLRQRAISRGSNRNGRIALGRPACVMSIRPECDLRAPMHKEGLFGFSGYVARIETNLGEQWNTAVRKIREKLKM